MAGLAVKAGIYSIRNRVSGRIYVGSSIDVQKRFRAHRRELSLGRHHAKALQRSWSKHGPDAFEFTVIEAVELPDQLIEREQHWIDALNAACPRRGFNSSPTAGNCFGVRHSDATKAKLSAARKGRPKSEAHRRAIGEAQKGKVISEAQRAQASLTTRAFFESNPEARERMREVGRRNGAASKGRLVSDEARAAYSAARVGNEKFAASSRANLAKASPEAVQRGREKTAAKARGRPNQAVRTLSFAQAEQCRALRREGLTYRELAKRFNSNPATMCRIVQGKFYQKP